MAETEQLTAELQRERETRAVLEARLERAEAQLRGMERAQQAAVRQDLEGVRLQQQLWGIEAERPAPAAGPVLQTWLLQARMSAVDAGAQTSPAHVHPQPVPLMDAAVFARTSREDSTAYIQRGEEVSRLKRELGAARAGETRALERLRELERRVAEVDAQAAAMRAAQAERQAPPLPWTETVLERRPTPEEALPAVEVEEAVGIHPEEAEIGPISDALTVPELERRVQFEPSDAEKPVEESVEEPVWQRAETEVALRTFARSLQDRPEGPEVDGETLPPAPPEADAATPEVPETPMAIPAEEPADLESSAHSAFAEAVQAWSAREAERAAPAPEGSIFEETEEPGTPGGPRPDDRTEAMVEALQRLIGKKPE